MPSPSTNRPKSSRNRGSKLFFFLSRMEPQERAGFAEWLSSPLHENSPQLREMLELLLKLMESEDSPHLTPEMFHPIISPERPLDDGKANYIWTRLAHLQKALFDFLAWQHFTRDTDLRGQFLLEALVERGWEKHILSTYESAARELEKSRLPRNLRKKLNLETTLNGYLASHGSSGQDKHLDQVHEAIDGLVVLEKLKYACAGLMEGHPESDPVLSLSLNTALKIVDERGELLPRVTRSYLAAFRMLRAELKQQPESEKHFDTFSELFEGLTEFSADEALDLFTYGQNYCILRHRAGGTGFVEALQRLYHLILESGSVLQKGLMPQQFYKNTVELMCRFGRFEWSEKFVEDYQDKIAHDPEKHVYHYNLAVIRFYQAGHQEVVQLLYNRLGGLDRMQLGVSGRVYFCQSLWETEEHIWLLSVLGAFEQHLRRAHYLDAERKAGYQSFVKYLRKLCLAFTGDPGKKLANLKKLQQEMDLMEPKQKYLWIRGKLAEALQER